ncbi:hypothetical protein LINPERHAP2_LOCUS42924 [Linum perenne]
MDPSKEVAREVFPFLRVFKNGTVQRLVGTESLPPSRLRYRRPLQGHRNLPRNRRLRPNLPP